MSNTNTSAHDLDIKDEFTGRLIFDLNDDEVKQIKAAGKVAVIGRELVIDDVIDRAITDEGDVFVQVVANRERAAFDLVRVSDDEDFDAVLECDGLEEFDGVMQL